MEEDGGLELKPWQQAKDWDSEDCNDVCEGTYVADGAEYDIDEYDEERRRTSVTKETITRGVAKGDKTEDAIWNPPAGEALSMKQLYKAIRQQKIVYFEKNPKARMKLWLFALDSSPASARAFEEIAPTLKRKNDCVLLVHVRLQPKSVSSRDSLMKAYADWDRAIALLHGFHLRLKEQKVLHAALTPIDHDPRKAICLLTKNNKADFLVVGLHTAGEKGCVPKGEKYPHWRSFHKYCKSHARGKLVLVN